MGTPILIIGKSGSGKSTSLRNYTENDNIGIINVLGKPLPFRNKLKTFVTDNYEVVMEVLTKAKADTLVIDDAGYLMTNQFMKGHSTHRGGNAFAFYSDIGDKFYALIRYVSEVLPPNKIVYFMMHEYTNDFGEIKPKTIGKMLDEKVDIPGMFTMSFRCMFSNGKHIFKTKTQGLDVCKTPLGMYDEEEIDNDLKAVDKRIRKYYGLNESEENKGD